MTTVTIGVTCKNSRSTIKQCIDSLLNQNYPFNSFKVFVVDAFSADGTYEILKKYVKNPARKRIRLEQIEGNIAAGHNHIIKNSFTELIALVDSDCVADKNWLKNLTEPFKDNKINATAGIMKTPEDTNRLQRLIGIELETRFKKFPEFIPRAPTANLCFRTKFAKETLFDEKYDVAQETEWGYRYTEKYGLMKFIPKAIVYHYHRATWKSFFKQQYRYGKFVPSLYMKFKSKAKGDPISTRSMMIQVLLLYFLGLSLLFVPIGEFFVTIFLLLFLILELIYFYNLPVLDSNKDRIELMAIFIVRNIAWNLGILAGIYKVFG